MAVFCSRPFQQVQRKWLRINADSSGTFRFKSSTTTHYNAEASSDPQKPKSKVEGLPLAKEHPKNIDLTFSNEHEAFRSKTTSELLRALIVFSGCSIPFLVNNNKQVIL